VQRAAAVMRQQILDFVASKWEVSAADLDLQAGQVTVRGAPASSMDLAGVAREALSANCELRATAATETANAPTFVAQFVELDVDIETGQIRVQRLVTAQEVGRAINPQIVIGQIQGAAHQGLGYALSETLIVDPETGTLLNGSFMDYRVPTAMDAPTSEVILVENPAANGPFGARGVAEQGLIPTAAAVANAILHATGASVTELPFTPERVLAALRKQSVENAT
jgi:CO/xanthine dehydrogenase Mo-binding subunit